MRICPKCNSTREEDKFNSRYRICKICRYEVAERWRLNNKDRVRETARLWAKNNPERTKAYQLKAYKRRYAINRKWFDTLKSAPCKDCNQQYPHYIMEFDHVGEKKFSLASAWHLGRERVLNELAKCDIVCANCHRRRTWERRQQPRRIYSFESVG